MILAGVLRVEGQTAAAEAGQLLAIVARLKSCSLEGVFRFGACPANATVFI